MMFQVFDPAECFLAVGVVAPAHGTTGDVHVVVMIYNGGDYGTLALRGRDLNSLELADLALGFVERHFGLKTVAVRRRTPLLLLHVIMTRWWLCVEFHLQGMHVVKGKFAGFVK